MEIGERGANLNMTVEVIPKILKQTVEKYGDRVAMRKKEYGLWHDTSWNQLYGQVKNVGAALISMGLKRGDCVSIIGDNCPEWVIIDLATQCAGGVAVGVYSTNAWPQVEYVVENSESKFFFVENEEQLDKWLHFRDKVPQLKKVIVWDLEGLRQFEDPMVMTFDDILKLGGQVRVSHGGGHARRSLCPYIHLGYNRPAKGSHADPQECHMDGGNDLHGQPGI